MVREECLMDSKLKKNALRLKYLQQTEDLILDYPVFQPAIYEMAVHGPQDFSPSAY